MLIHYNPLQRLQVLKWDIIAPRPPWTFEKTQAWCDPHPIPWIHPLNLARIELLGFQLSLTHKTCHHIILHVL